MEIEPAGLQYSYVPVDCRAVERHGSDAVVRHPHEPSTASVCRVVGQAGATDRHDLIVPVAVHRATVAPVAGIASRTGCGVALENAVDEIEMCEQMPQCTSATASIVHKDAAHDRGRRGSKRIDRATGHVLSGARTHVVVKLTIDDVEGAETASIDRRATVVD